MLYGYGEGDGFVARIRDSFYPPSVISVNASQATRVLTNTVFGLNMAAWDAHLDSPETLMHVADTGTEILRFPGGSIADVYDWQTGRNVTNNQTSPASFDAFARVATGTGAEAIITVNYGSGTPEEAAAWVRYSNVTKGYGSESWEIGNENYGSWEYDVPSGLTTRCIMRLRAKQFYAQMKAADPTIKVGVPVVPTEECVPSDHNTTSVVNPRTGQAHSGWTPVLLSALASLGVMPDFVVHHEYPQNPGQENDRSLLQSATNWTHAAHDLRQQLNDYLGSANAAQVEVFGPGKQLGVWPTREADDQPGERALSGQELRRNAEDGISKHVVVESTECSRVWKQQCCVSVWLATIRRTTDWFLVQMKSRCRIPRRHASGPLRAQGRHNCSGCKLVCEPAGVCRKTC